MKKILSIILTILMIVTTVPFAFAAGDGVPLTIDVTDAGWVKIGSEYNYYDEDGYILTGTSSNVTDVYESSDLTFKDITISIFRFGYADDGSVMNITLEGTNEVTNFVMLTSEHLIFKGNDDATFKAPYLSTSGNDGTVTVNSGNIVLERVTDGNSPTMSCADFIINGGTVTASNTYYAVISGRPVKLNGGTLNVISTSESYEAIQSDIIMDKGALLTISSAYGLIRDNSDILMADGIAENNAFFVRYDTTSDFVLVADIKAALEGKTYAEIKVDSHSHSFVDGICECGYECLHTSTYQSIIRPVQNADGTWGKGKVVKICNICGNTSLVQEVERDHEGYAAFDAAAAELEAILNSDEIIEGPKNGYMNTLNGIRNSAYSQVYTEIEGAISSMTESLNGIIAQVEAGLADGTMKKADLSYMASLFDEINAIINGDAGMIIPVETGKYYGPNAYYKSQLNNSNLSQAAYNRNMEEYDFENQLIALLAGLKDGTMLKADYTEIDEAIDDIEEKLASENVTDEGKAELEEIKKQLEEMKADENTSAADVAELEKALENYEEELDKGIEDGTLVKVDGLAIINELNSELTEKLIDDHGKNALEEFYAGLSEEAYKSFEDRGVALFELAASLTGSVKENEEKIAELKAELHEMYTELDNCLNGTHNGLEYTVTEEAKCGVNAIESATCTLCGETDEREVEGTALSHSFTKYEVTEEAKCGVAGKEIAACDNGCGATDEKEIPALKHSFLDYVSNGDATCTADGTKTAECENSCGETDTVTDEGTKLSHVDEDGDKLCDNCGGEIIDACPDCGGPAHGDSLVESLICLIIMLINLIVSMFA